jgi:glycosyltransferase involved in cell wall biosynthesis
MESGSMNMVHTISGLKQAAGGVSRSVPGLCVALSRAGAYPVLVSQRDRNSPNGSPLLPDPDVVPTRLVEGYDWERLRFSFTPGLSKALAGICAETRPSLLHDHGLWLHMNHVAATVTRRLKIRRVVSPRGMLDDWSMQYRGWKKRLAWSTYQRDDLASASAFSVTSAREAASVRHMGFRHPIAIVPNGIDLPDLSGPAPDHDGERTLLFMSRIHPKKGLLDLVKAWAISKKPGWKLVIAGPDEGGYLSVVRRAVLESGVQQSVDVIGAVDGVEKERTLRSASLFVLPTYSENFGIVVGEALSYGVPVITTNVTPWEELRAHECGWWVDIGVEALAGALGEACEMTDGQRRAMGMRGRSLIEKSYSWRSVAEAHLEFYAWLLTGHRKPSCLAD